MRAVLAETRGGFSSAIRPFSVFFLVEVLADDLLGRGFVKLDVAAELVFFELFRAEAARPAREVLDVPDEDALGGLEAVAEAFADLAEDFALAAAARGDLVSAAAEARPLRRRRR